MTKGPLVESQQSLNFDTEWYLANQYCLLYSVLFVVLSIVCYTGDIICTLQAHAKCKTAQQKNAPQIIGGQSQSLQVAPD